MNRAFITPKNGIKILGPVIEALIAKAEASIPSLRSKGITTTDHAIEHDGKRYSGSMTLSAVGDMQFDVDHVENVTAKSAASPSPVKKAPKKAAKKATAKKASK